MKRIRYLTLLLMLLCSIMAKAQFNPTDPTEPGPMTSKLKLMVSPRANSNSGYQFVGWYNGASLVSSEPTFEYTMGNGSVTLEARFMFNPNSPGEPDQIKPRKFSFMLRGVITKPGAAVQFPILLTPLATLGDMTFQLNFDKRLNVDVENAVLAETSTPYTLSREEMEPDADLGEGFKSYKFTLTGGSMVVGENEVPQVTSILTFPVTIPDNIETATSYKISINQISMTNDDGSTQTAGTRNGRMYIYKNGDANGDDSVDIYDYIGVANNILNITQDSVFIKEVGDVNNDGKVDLYDYIGVAGIIVNGSAESNSPIQTINPQGPMTEPE